LFWTVQIASAEANVALDPQNVPLSAFDDEDLFHMLTDGRQDPDADPVWLQELEAEHAERQGDLGPI
jgi:hypothetical protein